MYDQVPMCITHRVEHLQEQHDAFTQAECVHIAPTVDGHAIDTLHHEIGFALSAESAVQ